jgi:hypothetical protein
MLVHLLGRAAGGMAILGQQNAQTASLASKLLNANFNPQVLRGLDVLRKDEWLQIDQAVLDVARQELTVVTDMLAAGMRYNLPNALGHTVLEWERMTGMEGASVNMSGIAEGPNDRILFDVDSLPIPIVHRDFHINIRALAASRNRGTNLDTAQAREATRLVTEKIEEITIKGYADVTVGGKTIYGLRTAPNRNTGSLTANWATATGEQIVGDILTMIGRMHGDHQRGPYNLYVPLTYFDALLKDFKTNSDKSILTRIMEMNQNGVRLINSIKMSEYLSDGASGEVIMLKMSPTTADIVVGMQPTPLQWESHGGMVSHFKIMAIMVPRMKYDSSTQSGIVHYSV